MQQFLGQFWSVVVAIVAASRALPQGRRDVAVKALVPLTWVGVRLTGAWGNELARRRRLVWRQHCGDGVVRQGILESAVECISISRGSFVIMAPTRTTSRSNEGNEHDEHDEHEKASNRDEEERQDEHQDGTERDEDDDNSKQDENEVNTD